MQNPTIEEILTQWENEKISQNPGVTSDLIAAIENIIGFKFPKEFKELYSQINGFANNDWRENMFSIWPLERILEEYSSSEDKNFVGFADFLINSHNIGFLKTQAGVFKTYRINEYFLISNSFIDAIKLINTNADLIY